MRTVQFEKVTYRPLNDIVYERIKGKIIDNELLPGEKLDISRLAEELGVSRTPVSNALKELVQKGYVTINPRSGSYVREHTREEIAYIFDFREALERLIACKIIENLDLPRLRDLRSRLARLQDLGEPDGAVLLEYLDTEMELHEYMLHLCPPIVSDKVENLVDLTKRLRKLHLRYLTEVRGEVGIAAAEIRMHLDIADALLAGNADKAEEYILRDIRETRDAILADFDAIEAFARGMRTDG